MLHIFLQADLNFYVLSDKSDDGKPHLLANLRKARRNDSASRWGTKCTACVEAHVNRQT